jgi:hypothetical protein
LNRWFCAAPRRRLTVAGEGHVVPAFNVHAKEMGTLLTACGVNAGAFIKFYDVSFLPIPEEACQDCVGVVTRSLPR